MTSRSRRLVAAAASTVLLGLSVAACSAGGSDESGNDSSAASGESSVAAEPVPAAPEAAYDDAGSAEAADVAQTASGAGARSETTVLETVPADPRSLIKEGNVALQSSDVRSTLGQLRKVLQENRGEVSNEDTQADEDGRVELSLLTVRVPVDRYEEALEGFKALGAGTRGVKLVSSTSTTQDVSTEVVDTDVRVELQKRSIERISLLLDRATSLRDIVSIERELASREADLGSLEARQKLLTDQTSYSTITLSVERPAEEETPPEPKDDDEATGFAAGLENGWDAFRSVTTGLLTGAGALLPFAVVALLVGVPLRVWLRRRQPRPVVGTTAPTAGV